MEEHQPDALPGARAQLPARPPEDPQSALGHALHRRGRVPEQQARGGAGRCTRLRLRLLNATLALGRSPACKALAHTRSPARGRLVCLRTERRTLPRDQGPPRTRSSPRMRTPSSSSSTSSSLGPRTSHRSTSLSASLTQATTPTSSPPSACGRLSAMRPLSSGHGDSRSSHSRCRARSPSERLCPIAQPLLAHACPCAGISTTDRSRWSWM
mmetsp:Transcript_4550/g.13229  ORF Transcript_4550/g.13229 Transcript_4550/m.13229 type:complete len:212 (+) Transcript_4550:464-1099(+)